MKIELKRSGSGVTLCLDEQAARALGIALYVAENEGWPILDFYSDDQLNPPEIAITFLERLGRELLEIGC